MSVGLGVRAVEAIETSNGRSTATSKAEIRNWVLTELAVVQALELAELEREVETAGGDVEIDSPQAETILARLEYRFDCKLPAVSDLDPEQFNSISALIDLIGRRLPPTVLSSTKHGAPAVRVA